MLLILENDFNFKILKERSLSGDLSEEMKLCASKFNLSFAIIVMGNTPFFYMDDDRWPAGKIAESYFGKQLGDI